MFSMTILKSEELIVSPSTYIYLAFSKYFKEKNVTNQIRTIATPIQD